MTAAAFMAAQATVVSGRVAAWRRLNLSAGYQYDRRVNREGQNSAATLADLQANRQYLKALTDSGQLANFQSLTPG